MGGSHRLYDRRRAVVVTTVVGMVLLVALFILCLVIADIDLGVGANVAQLASVLLAEVPLVVSLLKWRRDAQHVAPTEEAAARRASVRPSVRIVALAVVGALATATAVVWFTNSRPGHH